MKRLLIALLTPVLGMTALVVVNASVSPAASAQEDTRTRAQSSGTYREPFLSSQRTCSVFANGSGMGSFCVRLGGGGGGPLKSLRERFGGQKFQECRYGEFPGSMVRPRNPNPGKGRMMLMRCIRNIDFDTFSGGDDRALEMQPRFVPFGTDTRDVNNGLSEYLWREMNRNARFPVPYMVTKPTDRPVVGAPTYFTFQWRNPVTRKVVAKGPYADREFGGPFEELNRNGFVMRARATELTINPNQKDMKPITCDPSTPYREGAKPKNQPKDACMMKFRRSSASARKLATERIPGGIDESFYASIEVRWEVTYGESGGSQRELGDGFTMRLKQIIPVQEVQAANEPPTF